MLVPRKSLQTASDLPQTQVDWESLLADDEQIFLTDNQLSLFTKRDSAGGDLLHFYPLPFAHTFQSGKWDFPELINHDSLRVRGPVVDFSGRVEEFSFSPYAVRKRLVGDGASLAETCAVRENTAIYAWDAEGVKRMTVSFELPYFAGSVERDGESLLVGIKDSVYMAISLCGAENLDAKCSESPAVSCSLAFDIPADGKISLAISFGYDRESALRTAVDAARDPQALISFARHMWDEFFTRTVPHFSCSDETLTRLYYYYFYITRANMYDIPYEPFTHPYVAPWKSGALWQWTWNTPMNSICERWLNDKRIGEGGIRLLQDNGGALSIGTWLHPLQKVVNLRDHNERHAEIGRYMQKLPDDLDMHAACTMNHTTPNGLLGAWEIFCASQNEEFLSEALEMMLETEQIFSVSETESGLCTCSFVDEFDYSLRLKPFVTSFSKGDPEMMFKMDTPFIAVDYNCYLHAFREMIIKAANRLGADVDVAELAQKTPH